jgi:hypothetical protein
MGKAYLNSEDRFLFAYEGSLEMFSRIEAAIIAVLKENLEKVPKANISSKGPGLGAKLPAIQVSNVSFEVKDAGFGQSIGAEDSLLEDVFSGDGAKQEFELSEKPLRPLISVEHPLRRSLSEDDYTVDYRAGTITFRRPPAEGEGNIRLRYSKPSEVKGMQLSMVYHIDVWAGDEAERDGIAAGVLEALLKEDSNLHNRGVYIRPIRGFNIDPREDAPKGGLGKTIECSVETEMRVEVPHPRMEEIELKRPERV